MKTKPFLLIILVVILAASVILPKFRKSPLLESVTLVAKGIEDEKTVSLYFISAEELTQHPVALLKRSPKTPEGVQPFELYFYRNPTDIKEEGEQIPCQVEKSTKYEGKEGTVFKVSISYSITEENPFEIFINDQTHTKHSIGKTTITPCQSTSTQGDAAPIKEENAGDYTP